LGGGFMFGYMYSFHGFCMTHSCLASQNNFVLLLADRNHCIMTAIALYLAMNLIIIISR
jgi:hypothetical protein